MSRIATTVVIGAGIILAGCRAETENAAPGRPPVPVVVAVAILQPVTETLPLVGSLSANEMVEIKSEIDGVVQEIGFREGERVEEGHLLVVLDESKLAAAVAEAEANFNLSQITFERSRQLLEQNLISRQEYDQAASTFKMQEASLDLKQRQLQDCRIYTPFAGVVGARNISPGQVISRNTILTAVVDVDPIKVEMNVPERFLGQLHVGQTINLGVAAFPGRPFQGEVYFIAPHVDLATRTALVKAIVPNPDLELRPGMFAHLELTLNLRNNAVVIPEAAIARVMDNSRATVFVVDENSAAQLRRVRLGVRMAREVEVLEGIEPGDVVIVEGVQRIGPGAPVRGVSERANNREGG
jgi:membrane fusion protein, multidrug efflux system